MCHIDHKWIRELFMMSWHGHIFRITGGCFTNVSRDLQNNIAKIHNTRKHIDDENFKLKLCTCAQSMALGTHTKCKLEIFIRSTISAIHKFRENILESMRNISETTTWPLMQGTLWWPRICSTKAVCCRILMVSSLLSFINFWTNICMASEMRCIHAYVISSKQ